MSLLEKLKRRNLFRIGLAYVFVAWAALQVADFATQVFKAPDWILQVLTLGALLRLPIVLIFSWVFEITSEGIKLESEIDLSESVIRHTSQKLSRVIIIFLVLSVIFLFRWSRHTEPKPVPMSGHPDADLAVARTVMDEAKSSRGDVNLPLSVIAQS